ncbi:MAG TPA: MarR family winged helix-turn-helix transcriptional regulator [Pseudonocardiaceae bacterium]|jgi:DNA-binding MarR family transcriptional regulator|nr:MarR family winged helix-turn-helix transcriptional regulator [Pseudonocardiaceae bacterium]
MDDARWLSADQQQVWRNYLAATRMVESELERQLQRDSGLPMTYFEIMVSLSEAPDRTLRMSELAERSRFSRSRLSHAIARMEAQGWVERRGCPSDKRGAFAVLTEKGFAMLADAAPSHVDQVRSLLFDVLSADQVEQLGEICATLRKAGPDPFGPSWGC